MKNEDRRLTIVEHLSEFRRRFIACILCFFLVFCGALLFSDQIYAFLTAGFREKLLALGPNDILSIYLQLASLIAFTITLPSPSSSLAFVKPALRKGEAGAILLYVPASLICFLLGLLFGYYLVSPAILEVLLKLGQGQFTIQLTAQNYLAFIFHTTVPLGVLFELPVLVAFLTSIHILTPDWLRRYRRIAYFLLLVLAVVLTPADFISDLAMTAPLILLYEVSLGISRIIYNRIQKRR